MILYFDTQDRQKIIVGLKKNGRFVEKLEDKNEFGSEVLLSLVVKLLKKNNLNFKDLKGIEIEEGPGSFTGLKVGASIAQALGFALNIPVNGKINKPLEIRYT